MIASEPVNCLSLSRTDFNRLLGQLKVKLVASHGSAGDGSNIGGKSAGINDAKRTLLAKKRRVIFVAPILYYSYLYMSHKV